MTESIERTSYHHGDLKSALLDETVRILRDEGFSRYAAAMEAVQKRSRMLDGRGRTYAVVKTYIDFARKNPEYYDLMYGSSWIRVWGY